MNRGSHIMLDCTGANGVEGSWMLELMQQAVDQSGATRVHSHVEIFDGSRSPPGFAAVVLLDESHVSAHCYSEGGILAIDAFTCGNTEPEEIVNKIESKLRERFPGLITNHSQKVGRFMSENSEGGIKKFVDRHFQHFNAGALQNAAKSLANFLNEGGKLVITLAGAMSTAEIGKSLAPLIRSGKVHAICCTGANLEEDVFHLVAGSSYRKIPDWRNLTAKDEAELHEQGFNRVTDTCIPEELAIRTIEKQIVEQWKKHSAFPHEHLMAIIEDIDHDMPSEDSWLLAAKHADIPVFVPGWEDSTLGNIFTAHCISGEVETKSVKSGIDYMMMLAEWYSSQDNPVGLLQIGGGIAGDFPICVVPMLRQDMGRDVSMWAWFAQISEASASYGGYSGAYPSEKITWGKLAPDTPMHIIESDASIVAPILFSYILD